MANSALYTGNDFQIGHHSVLSYQRDRRYLLRIISRRLISAHHEICGSLQLAIHLLFGETALATFVATHIRIEKELQVKTYCLRWTAIVSCAVVVLFCANLSYAGSAADLGKDLDAARENMLKMLDAKDAASRDSAYSEVKKATESLNSGLAEMLTTAPDADRAKLNQFKGIWQAFISTRDTELVPAAQSGDAEKIASAKQKAGAVQKERLGKMKEVLTSLGAN